jgi:hypothetical protein
VHVAGMGLMRNAYTILDEFLGVAGRTILKVV